MKIAFVLAIVGLALPAASSACSCEAPPGPLEAQVASDFEGSVAVFLGYVHSEFVRTVADNPNYSAEWKNHLAEMGVESERYVRVRVLQVWKGNLARNSWIEMHADDSGSCGYPAEVDSAYVVFSHPESFYAMSICSNSDRVDVASEFMPLLNRLARKHDFRAPIWHWAAAAAFVALASLIGFATARARLGVITGASALMAATVVGYVVYPWFEVYWVQPLSSLLAVATAAVIGAGGGWLASKKSQQSVQEATRETRAP